MSINVIGGRTRSKVEKRGENGATRSPQAANPRAMNRIEGYDVARALAVFGMVIVNFKTTMGAERLGPEKLVGLLNLLDGRAAALFVVLAGIGISLLTRRALQTGDRMMLAAHRRSLLRRALVLFAVGLAYWPLWPADILHFYGVYIVVAVVFLSRAKRYLVVAATGFVLVSFSMLLLLDYDRGINWATLDYQGFWTPAGFFRNLFFNGFHPVFPWTGFMLAGMFIGRFNLSVRVNQLRLLSGGLTLVLLAELGSCWLSGEVWALATTAKELEDLLAVVDTAPMPPTPLYMLAGTGWAAIIVAACIALSQTFPRAGWLQPLVVTGQLALTLYVAHVVVGMGMLELIGRIENQTATFALVAALVFCLSGVVFALWWRSRFAQGPLEVGLRRLSNPG